MWDSALWRFAGQESQSGEDITEETALTYSAVFNAISLISRTIASLPLHLMQRKGKDTNPATTHNLYRVMHSVSNPYMTAMVLREVMMAHVLAWGNSYSEIVRNGAGRIIQLWPITPNRVQPQMVDGELVYEIKVGSETKVMSRDKILHIAGLGFDGFVGYSVISMARNSIGLGKAMESFGSLYFGQGTHPGAVVSHPSKLSAAAHKNLSDSLVTAHSGLGKAHRLMLLEEGMKIEKLGIPPNDSQFIEGRQFQIPEIARWFNLPPHKLKDLTKSSFNNIESEQISYVTDSLLPWSVCLEQNYEMQLLTEQEYKAGFYFKHVFEGLLRGNSKDRAEFYSKMWNIGAMTINEIRGKEDLNPVEGGDTHLVPLNMTTLDQAGKPQEIQNVNDINNLIIESAPLNGDSRTTVAPGEVL
jgi:HK97 family phage portal protein